MKRTEMPLPLLRRCCGCLSLRTGCFILCIISTMACAANIAAGAWNLPRHREREPEDNLISMSMVMFSTLSAISNLIALFGIILKRPSKLQLSLVFNSVFIFCIFLVAIVTCLFRLDDFLRVPGNIVLIVFLLIAGAMYSLYYLTMINSLYRIMKMAYGESAIPV
uniref:PGG domain-containing protein n=1 Tax=Heliothis virescens TaxID=7102 RepID=A0A2A4K177_HELVI